MGTETPATVYSQIRPRVALAVVGLHNGPAHVRVRVGVIVMEAAEEPAKDCVSVSDSDSDSDSGYRNRGHGSSEQSVTAELGDGVSEEGVFDGRTQTPMSGTAASSLD
jgi:hypothetical protein